MARVRQLLIGLASGSALYSGLAPALGLGEITLHSALSQPLDAEIELLNLGDLGEAEVKVRLAPPEVFSRSGVDRLYFLNDLRFTPIFSRGRGVIRVVSARPVREPYLNFIVEVSRPTGDLYREYTLLLDPPGSSAYRTAAAPVASLTAPAPRLPASSPAPVPRAPRELPAATTGQRYTVVSGDSLWKIAARLRDAGSPASQQALMGDIHALNPSAFSRGDINRLLAGAELLLPDSAVASGQQLAAQPSPAAQASVAESSSLAPVDPPSEAVSAAEPLPVAAAPVSQAADPAQLLQEQQRVEAELANQITETVQLQQSLAELQLQVQQLQEEMSTRDRQIAGLQAELAARSAAVQNAAQEMPPAAEPPAEAQSQAPATATNGWLQLGWAGLGLAALGLLGLFWRSRSRPVPPVQTVKRAHVPSQAPVAVSRPVALASSREQAPAGPAWPPAGTTDALQSANVYIAYGRFSEAAANLRKALESQPGRNDIRFRLLEVLAQLGDAQGFLDEEARLRASGFTPARIDELKARHAQLFAEPAHDLLDEAVLQLDEEPAAPLADADADEAKLNLDDLSLDADWDLVTPFAQPKAKQRVTSEDVFELGSSRDARSPFAENMLVEESSNSEWVDDELDDAFAESLQAESSPLLDDLEHLAGNQDNLTKLNMALAYIEQGSLESACSILNEVIADGDEEQKQEARQLLAKIA